MKRSTSPPVTPPAILSDKNSATMNLSESDSESEDSGMLTKRRLVADDLSSSDSDIDNYLQPADKIDLSSSFFTGNSGRDEPGFDKVESGIFSGVNRLSDSYSSSSDDGMSLAAHKEQQRNQNHFKDIEEYNRQMQEAKSHIALYEAKRKLSYVNEDIANLLAAGEKVDLEAAAKTLHESDFEESDAEDWKEIGQSKKLVKQPVQTNDVEITIELPGRVIKKKGVDVMAAIKRRINRVKKEQQVFIHKVNLLCHIAHGNHVNLILTTPNLLGHALSLLPSEKSYPSGRVDLSYLEQILKWYRNFIKFDEKFAPDVENLERAILECMNKRKVHVAKMLVFIFICLLRGLGMHVRLVMNLRVMPLRPPNSELCSLSTKSANDGKLNNPDLVKIKKVLNQKCSNPNAQSASAKASPMKTLKSDTNASGSNKNGTSPLKVIKTGLKSLKSEPGTSKVAETIGTKSISAKIAKVEHLNVKKSVTSLNKNGNSSSKTAIRQSSKSTAVKKTAITKVNSIISVESNPTNGPTIVTTNKPRPVADKTVSKSGKNIFLPVIKLFKCQPPEAGTSGEAGQTSKPRRSTGDMVDNELTLTNLQQKATKRSKSVENPKVERISARKSVGDADSSKKVDNTLNGRFCNSQHASSSTPLPMVNASFKRDLTKPSTPTKLKHTSTLVLSSPVAKRTRKSIAKKISQLDGPQDDSSSSDSTIELSLQRIPQLDGNHDSPPKKKKPNLAKLKEPSRNNPTVNKAKEAIKKLRSKSDSSHSSYFSSPSKTAVDTVIELVQQSMQPESRARFFKKRSSVSHTTDDSGSDSDFVPSSRKKPKVRADGSKVKRRIPTKKELDRRGFSSDEEKNSKRGMDVWIEVFLDDEEKWICVDVLKGQVHCVKEIYSRASHPVSYILSWDNNNGVKDVTQRYEPNWNTVTRKLRTEPDWWKESLRPFAPPDSAHLRNEDEELAQQQLDQPLPKSIAEYKNHPLYALKRHLLKFEAIYPVDAMTLGFVREEPVYSRDCVHTLHSREIWLKHAKVVRPGEQPYKIVKARPKYDKLSNTCITDKPLEIFGHWQVEDYVPPTAKNGVVPRNAYGNVELFKPTMLPFKTVHLQLPGMNKVARKLNIDCAPAVVGFDYHSGGCHAVFDGYIVCEEFKDTLLAAWETEQEEAHKRAVERIEKRVYGNWRRLIKSVLIRERLKKRYDFGASTSSNKKKIAGKGDSKLKLIKRKNCSDSDSD